MEEGAGRRGIPSLLNPPARADEAGGATSPQQEHIASDITQLVGWTPLVELRRIAETDNVNARIVGKLECYQPLCSVKDRSALRMIEDAEERGLISPGATTLVEPTSGNMGIALAYIALARGYRFVAVMPAEYSLDKQILLRYLGADLVLTDPALGFQGQLDKLEQLRKEIPNAHVLDQFANAANPEAHFRWTGSTDLCKGPSGHIRVTDELTCDCETLADFSLSGSENAMLYLVYDASPLSVCAYLGPEIWRDTAGKVDIFVAGSGTGGTVSGVGRYLKTKNPAVKVVCVEPAESPVISGGKASRHKIQGVGPGFVPKNLDTSVTDEIVTVTAEDAMANARRLAREEGLLVGISSGANLAACLKVASRQENRGKMIVTVFPSGGERYVNSDLFADAREECVAMTF